MDFLINITPAMLGLIAIVVGITQIFKPFISDSRFYPVISLVLGVAASFLVPQANVAMTILAGLVMGLSASGAYSTGKTLTASQ
jgi:uncharacterized membrane protein HdeD (DUF308 family)